MARSYWLMKSEPGTYSIQDLEKDGKTGWDGVRNYQARNFMRDRMKVGDLVLFYHSSANPPGVAGIARVCERAHPDPTQFQKKHPYYDPQSPRDDPRWWMVSVEPVEIFDELVTLDRIKGDESLASMLVVQKGQRLSVQPVEKAHFKRVLKLGHAKTRIR